MAPEYNPDYNVFNINLNIIDKKKMRELNLDIIDLLILRWFHNWYTHYKMLKEVEGGTEYYWVNYSAVVREFDIGGITSISGARRRLLRLCGEEGNDVATPLLKRITRNYKAYSSQVFFHLNESLFFSIVSRGNIGSGIKPPEIEEEFNSTPQDKAIEVPAEEPSSNLITPDTITFIDKVLSLNPQFSKPRINLTEPSKTLCNIQEYRQSILDGTFMERQQKYLPANLRSIVLPVMTEDDLCTLMAGVKLTSKMSISDYFLSYNNNTKTHSSMFLSYMSKRKGTDKPVAPSKAVVSEIKITGMHPKALAYVSNANQVEAYRKLGITDMNAVARVADSIYSWYEAYPTAYVRWGTYALPKNVLWAMKGFMEAWKEKVGKTPEEFFSKVEPFNTGNHQWLLFARYIWKNSDILLHNKLSCSIIQSSDDAWWWIDYGSLRKDIG